jgi:hypothetical protein
MAKQFVVNGETFKTQGALVDRVREIIKRNKPGVMVDLFDELFLRSLLDMHPEASQKIGCGVVAFSVEDNPMYPGPKARGLRLHRVDGTSTDFSFWECIRPTPHIKKVQRAFRAAIEPDTMAFKQRYFDGLPGRVGACPDTGEPITYTSCHVDHKAPNTFDVLFARFIDSERLNVDDVQVYGASIDDTYQDRLVDLALEQRWREFHNATAVLEVVSVTANLSLRKKVQP